MLNRYFLWNGVLALSTTLSLPALGFHLLISIAQKICGRGQMCEWRSLWPRNAVTQQRHRGRSPRSSRTAEHVFRATFSPTERDGGKWAPRSWMTKQNSSSCVTYYRYWKYWVYLQREKKQSRVSCLLSLAELLQLKLCKQFPPNFQNVLSAHS